MIRDRHEIRVYNEAGVQLEHDLQEGDRITADRGWIPHVQGTVTVKGDSEVAKGERLTIELYQRFGDYSALADLSDLVGTTGTLADTTTAFGSTGTLADTTALLDAGNWGSTFRQGTGRTFHLLITGVRRRRDTITLTVESDEALIIDWIWWNSGVDAEGVPATFTAYSPGQILEQTIAKLQAIHYAAGIDVPILNTATPTATTDTEHSIAVGARILEYAQKYLTSAQQRLYSPGDGTLQIVDFPYELDDEIEINDTLGNLIDWNYNDSSPLGGVAIQFTGRAGVPAARPTFSEYSFVELRPPHSNFYTSDAPFPGFPSGLFSGIYNPATPWIERLNIEASPFTIVAVNDYRAMPGATVDADVPDLGAFTARINVVEWELGGDWHMTLTL